MLRKGEDIILNRVSLVCVQKKKKEKNSFLSFPLLLIALPAFALVSSCCAVDAARLPLSTTTHSSSVLSASSFAALATPCVVLIVWLATAHQPSFPLVFVIAIVRRPWALLITIIVCSSLFAATFANRQQSPFSLDSWVLVDF